MIHLSSAMQQLYTIWAEIGKLRFTFIENKQAFPDSKIQIAFLWVIFHIPDYI